MVCCLTLAASRSDDPRLVPDHVRHVFRLLIVQFRIILFWLSNTILFPADRQRLPDCAKHVSVEGKAGLGALNSKLKGLASFA